MIAMDGGELAPQMRPFRVRARQVQPGTSVAAIGFATLPGAQPTLQIIPGIIYGSTTDYQEEVGKLRIGIPASGGLSGGPVIDRGGNLVGIITETGWEKAGEGVPAQPIHYVLPVRHLLEIKSQEA